MSKLKVFVSSTCYDLESERKKLREFIEKMGYESVFSEYNEVFYSPDEHTHVSCVKAVDDCDFFVYLIGGRFGGTAVNEVNDLLPNRKDYKGDKISITQAECLRAIQKNIPRFVFIKKDVLADHYTYNKAKGKVDPNNLKSIEKADTAKYVFDFFDFLRKTKTNNAYLTFETVDDIIETLKIQWSFYFKKLLLQERLVVPVSDGTNNSSANYKEKCVEQLNYHEQFYQEYYKLCDEISNFYCPPESDWYENSPTYVWNVYSQRNYIEKLKEKYITHISEDVIELLNKILRLLNDYDYECCSQECLLNPKLNEEERIDAKMEIDENATRKIADELYESVNSVKAKILESITSLEDKVKSLD